MSEACTGLTLHKQRNREETSGDIKLCDSAPRQHDYQQFRCQCNEGISLKNTLRNVSFLRSNTGKCCIHCLFKAALEQANHTVTFSQLKALSVICEQMGRPISEVSNTGFKQAPGSSSDTQTDWLWALNVLRCRQFIDVFLSTGL